MKKLHQAIILLLVILLSSCKAEEDFIVTCTDTRDGEVFSFWNSTAYDGIWLPGSGFEFKIIDTKGKERIFWGKSEMWLKCGRNL